MSLSPIKCTNCEVNLVRIRGEFQPDRLDLPDGYFPSKKYHCLDCPSCNWFCEWKGDRSFEDVESILRNCDQQELKGNFYLNFNNMSQKTLED